MAVLSLGLGLRLGFGFGVYGFNVRKVSVRSGNPPDKGASRTISKTKCTYCIVLKSKKKIGSICFKH